MPPPAAPSGKPQRLPWALAWRLGVGQIFAWGILYYTFTVIVDPLLADSGWSRTFVNVGLSVGLLTWGLCTYPVGMWIQRRGARGLMTTASLLGALALVLMGTAHTKGGYLASWLCLGAAMAGQLYEPAFAVVTAAFGPNYRRGITLITLVGGLASTAFIPLAQLAVSRFGWRDALIALGALQAIVGTPLHWWGIPQVQPRAAAPAASMSHRVAEWWRTLRADVSDPRFVGLALWFTAHSVAFTGLVFQMIPLLQARDVPANTIMTAIAIMGPMQVAGRLFLSARGHAFSTLRVGGVAMAIMLASLLVLLLLPPTLLWLGLFTGALGLGNGILTVVRGTAVAELFGRERYAEINGTLAAPGVLARAASPLLMASIWSAFHSPLAVPCVGVVVLLVGSAALLYLIRRAGREPSDTIATPQPVTSE